MKLPQIFEPRFSALAFDFWEHSISTQQQLIGLLNPIDLRTGSFGNEFARTEQEVGQVHCMAPVCFRGAQPRHRHQLIRSCCEMIPDTSNACMCAVDVEYLYCFPLRGVL